VITGRRWRWRERSKSVVIAVLVIALFVIAIAVACAVAIESLASTTILSVGWANFALFVIAIHVPILILIPIGRTCARVRVPAVYFRGYRRIGAAGAGGGTVGIGAAARGERSREEATESNAVQNCDLSHS